MLRRPDADPADGRGRPSMARRPEDRMTSITDYLETLDANERELSALRTWIQQVPGRRPRGFDWQSCVGFLVVPMIARLWRDARVQRLCGGTTEIMKDLMGRAMSY